MMGYTFKVEGLEELQKKLKKNVKLNDVKKVVKHNGMEMTTQMVKNADFKKGYQTGATKRSIPEASPRFLDEGLTVEAGATTEYAEYVERGTRFMEAQPFVGPAFNDQKEKFKRDMKRLMK